MEAAANLEAVLESLQAIRGEMPVSAVTRESGARLDWVKAQLKDLEASMKALLADVESGCSMTEMGFFGGEFDDMLADIRLQIDNLKTLVRSIKAIGLG